ncbi:potassium channel, subfamily K, member 16-like [Amphiura filiformis]|uniref:potassium channel, subfamily K, member 16-like n=1 Tax=Amphiura filiformis TaxID=82378 RepID=UPI003B20F79F
MKRYWRIVLLFSASAVYLSVGAGIFTLIEGPHELQTRQRLTQTIRSFLEENPTLTTESLAKFLKEIMHASGEGVRLNLDEDEESTNILGLTNSTIHLGLTNWDWPNAFFFTTTVVTTIGYGNMTPSTNLGRSMCIWFAFIGIPLMAWLLAEVGIQCKKRGKLLAMKLDQCLERCVRTSRMRKILNIILIGSMAYTLIVLIPAGLYSYSQGWCYTTAHYYCFITLSTIGFGDVVPTHQNKKSRYYRLLTSLYLVYGLAVVAIVFNVVQQIQRKQATKILQYCTSIGSTKIEMDSKNVGNSSEISLQNSALITDTDSIKRAFALDDASYDSPVRQIAETIPSKAATNTKDNKDHERSNSWDRKAQALPGFGIILYETAI